jgi:WD40 repeat protein
VALSGDGIRILDLDGGSITQLPADLLTWPIVSQDGGRLAVSHQEAYVIYDTETWQPVARVRPPWYGEIHAFSPDLSLLASAPGYGDPSVGIWDTQSGRQIQTLEAMSYEWGVGTVTFTPDGSLLLRIANDGAVDSWETSTWQWLPSSSWIGALTHAVWSDDGRSFLTTDPMLSLFGLP